VNEIEPEKFAALYESSDLRRVRRSANKANKEGVTYSSSYDPADLRYFLDMIHDVSKRTGMIPHSDNYYQKLADTLIPEKKAVLLFAEFEGKKIASCLIFFHGDTAYYAHAANYTEYRKLFPAIGLGVFAMQFCGELGYKFYDWYGVAPVGAGKDNPWSGFTEFKENFKGNRVHHVGTWELPVNKFKYTVYRLLRGFLG
jgi:lipid II:glycine glycyltransferase (peptidoglycan interpeptide bridge formation enzyme)